MEKVTVKMHTATMGSEHGNVTVKFEAGKEYTIMKELAKVFVDEMGCAVYTNEVKIKPIIRRKITPEPSDREQPQEPSVKIRPQETVEKQKEQPGEISVGDVVRNKKTGEEMMVTKVHYGWITFNDGPSIRSRRFSKEWELVS